jgi:Tfp pilus assembly protein PilZ
MKTVLDLIREFGVLSDAKVRRGGTLAEPDEKRWEELKRFYDLLMSQAGLPADSAPSISKTDLEQYLTDRARLRVPVRNYVLLRLGDSCHPCRVVNLSRSGVFVSSQTLFEVGARLHLHLANADEDEEDFLELEAEVIWATERGVPAVELPRGMGLRFVNVPPEPQEKLDAWVLDVLEKRLSCLW